MRYCEMCKTMTKVMETRDTHKRTVTRRRRECPKCGHRFTTYEMRGLNVVTTEREYVPVPAPAVDAPTAEEIAAEVVDSMMTEMDDRFGDLPYDTVQAMLAEAGAQRARALDAPSRLSLALPAADDDEDEDEDE